MQVRETAAEENATAYFPLLDRIAEGRFSKAKSEEELYESFLRVLSEDGHIKDPETIASFKFALSLHSAAPRIEAHHQFYKTSVEPSLTSFHAPDCDVWIDLSGGYRCDLDTLLEFDGPHE
jgi:UDP-glucose:glycoprotein glucosyltransferase